MPSVIDAVSYCMTCAFFNPHCTHHTNTVYARRLPQALDEMVQLLTEPAYMGKMVVILAGYDNEVRAAGAEDIAQGMAPTVTLRHTATHCTAPMCAALCFPPDRLNRLRS